MEEKEGEEEIQIQKTKVLVDQCDKSGKLKRI